MRKTFRQALMTSLLVSTLTFLGILGLRLLGTLEALELMANEASDIHDEILAVKELHLIEQRLAGSLQNPHFIELALYYVSKTYVFETLIFSVTH
jgi:hypothetical protein